MAITQQAMRFGQRRLTRRMARALPWVGTAVALATLGAAIRRKGWVRGSLDTTLNAMPVVGAVKGVVEVVRGRDFLNDRL